MSSEDDAALHVHYSILKQILLHGICLRIVMQSINGFAETGFRPAL
jgi:hypothetical protein